VKPVKPPVSRVPPNYYVTLGIAESAQDAEIKRAYFQLVRQYQPGQFPDEFKKIRAAYEMLMDPKKRADYDEVHRLPDSVQKLFYEAVWQNDNGDPNKTVELCETILKTHPKMTKVLELCADTLDATDKLNKASKIWQELSELHPDNADYARSLALCYMERGWHKKAFKEAQRAVELDPKTIENWDTLLGCTIAYKQRNGITEEIAADIINAAEAIKTIKVDEWKKIYIYNRAFVVKVKDEDNAAASYYIHEIIRLIRENGRNGQEMGENFLDDTMYMLAPAVLAPFYPEIKEIVDLLAYGADSDALEMLAEIRLAAEANALEKEGFGGIFGDLFYNLSCEPKRIENEIEILAIECAFLRDKSVYDPQLRRLRKDHPELYALHAPFFNETLRTRDPEKQFYVRSKKLNQLKKDAGIVDAEAPQDQPVRREAPKVGRNDPCPCGSGKKYKKCCGQ
jgi:tetratricopeptide (TPR) repeat protein